LSSYPSKPTGFTPSQDVTFSSLQLAQPNSSIVFEVTHSPIRRGLQQAHLEVFHDGGGPNPLRLELLGEGRWDANVVPTQADPYDATELVTGFGDVPHNTGTAKLPIYLKL